MVERVPKNLIMKRNAHYRKNGSLLFAVAFMRLTEKE